MSSQALDGVEGGGYGVLMLRDGTIRGGNSFFYYVGSYSCFAEGRWKGKATVQEHSPAPATMPMAGKVNHIGFTGTYTDEGCCRAISLSVIFSRFWKIDCARPEGQTIWCSSVATFAEYDSDNR